MNNVENINSNKEEQEAQYAVAQYLLDSGADLDYIIEITGLSYFEIKQLRDATRH